MNNKKTSLVKGSIIASAMIAAAGFNANAANLFSYSNLGTGSTVRTTLLNNTNTSKTIELTCGAKDSTAKKGKDGKCGEGKCGEGKCGNKKKHMKGKDHKCGEGKCGDHKKTK